MIDRLELLLLGAPLVLVDGRDARLPTRKALALLALLATQGGPYARDQLTALLWPEADPERARAALRNTLTYLRALLGEDARSQAAFGPGADEDASLRLHAGRAYIELHLTSADDVDLRKLERAERTVRDLGHTASDDALALLESGAGRYRGEFLAGFALDDAPEFEAWMTRQRETNRSRVTLILDRVSALRLDRGHSVGALAAAARWLELDPLNEAAHRRAIQIHLAAGDRSGALLAYERCRQALAAELGVEPDPQTEEIGRRARAAEYDEGVPPLAGTATPTIEWPLVGRSREFAALVESFDRARRGDTVVAIAEGEAGIGKTRLLAEFARWARAKGADVLSARAYEGGGTVSYQVIVDAFRPRLEHENAPDDLLPTVWLEELCRLFPELRDRYPDLPMPVTGDGAAQTRLFEAVTRLGQALARRAPLVFIIDDLPWIDQASRDLLQYAACHWKARGSAVLLAMTLRSEERTTSRRLGEWLADLRRDLEVRETVLPYLTFDDLRRAVEACGVRAAQSLATWLFAQTRGQPLYALESMRALADQGVLQRIDHADGNHEYAVRGLPGDTPLPTDLLPPRVRELISGRLARLTPGTAALLTAAAVLSWRSTFAALRQVAGLAEEEALPALEEALQRHLLLETPAAGAAHAPPVYLFSHDKIRDIVYTDAGDARRRVAHARAIDALRGAGAPATELAFHALAAGRLGDAYRFSVAAGDDALRVFAMRDAIGQYATAERVVLDHPALMTEAGTPADGNDARVADLFSQLLLQMGRAYEVVNERDEAQRTYQRLLEHARTWSQPTMECLALNRMATLIGQTGAGVERATPLLLEARRIAEAAGDRRGLAETEWNLAQSGVYVSDPAVASDHGACALALARELGDRDLVARSLNVLAYASWDLGQWERCDTYAGEAADLYGALGNRPLEVDSLALAAESKARVGRLHEGIVAARRALAGSEEIENPWGQVTSAYHLAPCLVDAGLYAEALAVATRGTAIAHAQGIPPLLVFSLVELGAARRALLDLEGAVAAHSEALALSATLQPIFRETSAAALCADYALAGRWHNAYEAGRLAAETRNPALLHTAFSRWLETEALIRGGEWERAQRDVARLGEQLGENRRLRIPYLRCQAVMDAAAGRPAAACRHLKEAADLARALALPGELWSIERACAALYLTLGDRHAAAAADSRAAVALQILAANVGDEAARAAFLNAATRLGGLSVKPA